MELQDILYYDHQEGYLSNQSLINYNAKEAIKLNPKLTLKYLDGEEVKYFKAKDMVDENMPEALVVDLRTFNVPFTSELENVQVAKLIRSESTMDTAYAGGYRLSEPSTTSLGVIHGTIYPVEGDLIKCPEYTDVTPDEITALDLGVEIETLNVSSEDILDSYNHYISASFYIDNPDKEISLVIAGVLLPLGKAISCVNNIVTISLAYLPYLSWCKELPSLGLTDVEPLDCISRVNILKVFDLDSTFVVLTDKPIEIHSVPMNVVHDHVYSDHPWLPLVTRSGSMITSALRNVPQQGMSLYLKGYPVDNIPADMRSVAYVLHEEHKRNPNIIYCLQILT